MILNFLGGGGRCLIFDKIHTISWKLRYIHICSISIRHKRWPAASSSISSRVIGVMQDVHVTTEDFILQLSHWIFVAISWCQYHDTVRWDKTRYFFAIGYHFQHYFHRTLTIGYRFPGWDITAKKCPFKKMMTFSSLLFLQQTSNNDRSFPIIPTWKMRFSARNFWAWSSFGRNQKWRICTPTPLSTPTGTS